MPSIATSRLLRRSLSAALLLVASGAACTDDEGMMQNPPDPTDTEAPLVVSTMPAANATGVAADQKLFVTFSEQMDFATVEAAYSSSQLPLDKVSLSWNPGGTVLTISPDQPLEYAAGNGTDPSAVEPMKYSITIGGTATDLAGNQLTAGVELTFETKRRMTASFTTDPDLTKALKDTGVLPGVSLFIGDDAAHARFHSYVTFDLSTLPAGGQVESATFKGRQQAPSGQPYGLGAVMAQHLTFATIADASAAKAMSLPGEFSTDATLETKSLDVTPQVKDDVANRATRGDHSQYRLQIDTETDNDDVADTAIFTKNTFSLTVEYVID